MLNMVDIFGAMGLVEARPGPEKDPSLPRSMLVAGYGPGVTDAGQLREVAAEQLKAKGFTAEVLAAPNAELEVAPAAANFASQEEAYAAPLPVRPPKR